MKYTSYDFYTHHIASAYCKVKELNKKQRKSVTIEEVLQSVIKTQPSVLVTNNGHFITHEWYWQSGDKTIIFPESTELLDSLLSGKYDIKSTDGIRPFTDSFILNFPKDYTLAGQKASSVLITFYSSDDHVTKLFDPLLEHLNLTDIEEYNIDGEKHTVMMDIVYRTHDSTANKIANYRKHIPFKYLPEALDANNFDLFKPLQSEYDTDLVGLNDKEKEYQFQLLKLIMSILVYIQAMKDVLVDGFPGQIRPNDGGSYLKISNPKDLTLKVSSKISERDSVKGHYRSWHLRQLNDARYYQGEYKDLPKGSRIIFVSDSYVNDDIDAKTLVKSG